jgi:glutamate/tyrosine decarboxylase-like PLP-dependent enzyme
VGDDRLPRLVQTQAVTNNSAATRSLLQRASEIACDYLDEVPGRRVPALATTDELLPVFGGPLPQEPQDPLRVLESLAAAAGPGLTTTSSPRFFGFVIGGTYPVAIAADWLTSAWDQNGGLREVTPALSAAREAVEDWVLDLLGLPPGATMGTVTGGMMANFTGLAAARHAVLARAGWDVEGRGLQGAPRVRVLVGQERHDTVDLALRYLGLGAPHEVAADDQGRIRVDALAEALAERDGPTILCLQAGNVHSGAFDDFAAAVPLAHQHGAWVHIDGAFGLWAAASPVTKHLTDGMALADSWATDAHKTLNVPYDCGLAIVADAATHRAALGIHAPYLIHSAGAPDPLELTPEFSQRGRAFPLWAVLASQGRTGIADLVTGLHRNAAALAEGVRRIGGEVLNDVVFTQVCTAWGDDERTLEVERLLMAEGEAWMTGSVWRGRRVLRIAVSNQATGEADVAASLAALERAARAAGMTGR